MQYGIGVEYALHCLVYLIDIPPESAIGIKELSTFQGVPETYLSKIFTKLTKTGIVKSVPGVKGGYKLARLPAEISFWDVVEAVEGASPIFQCKNIKNNDFLCRSDEELATCARSTPCIINLAMREAEEIMRNQLRQKSLMWLREELNRVLSPKALRITKEFFSNNGSV